jgi:hypothetical protein
MPENTGKKKNKGKKKPSVKQRTSLKSMFNTAADMIVLKVSVRAASPGQAISLTAFIALALHSGSASDVTASIAL